MLSQKEFLCCQCVPRALATLPCSIIDFGDTISEIMVAGRLVPVFSVTREGEILRSQA
jgi:hypothetical protein